MVIIEMENGGRIEIELLDAYAPNTARNFRWLVSQGFYDGLTFHRVISGFMIQGGCPHGNGTGGPGYRIPGEFTDNGFSANTLSHRRGIVSMARSSDPDSAGSQFFIMHADGTFLDGQYAAFGRVISGMDTVDAIAAQQTGFQDRPLCEQRIKSITLVDENEISEPQKS